MITLRKIRELDLAAAAGPGRPHHLSAASALVCSGPFLYVVADDELHLGAFGSTGAKPGHLIRLFAGTLPASKAKRKKRKPDLEALTLLPSFSGYPYGALLALGSGSRRNRRRGALLALDAKGAASGTPRMRDLSRMFTALNEHFTALNIEGAVVSGNELCLLQRGNKRSVQNAVIRFNLPAVLDALSASARVGSLAPSVIDSFDLGTVGAIPLCFTDGAALPNGDIVFTAIAEDTEDNYNDAPCAGAAIGIAGSDGKLRCVQRLDRPYKIEGIDARVEGDVIRLLLVSDADDADVPACLYSAAIGDYLGGAF